MIKHDYIKELPALLFTTSLLGISITNSDGSFKTTEQVSTELANKWNKVECSITRRDQERNRKKWR